MVIIGVISETLLYLCFSILMGSFILKIVPESVRPRIVVPNLMLIFSIIGIAVLSFIPVLQITLLLYKDYGWVITIKSVLFTFEEGKGWIVTFFVSIIMFFYVSVSTIIKDNFYYWVGILFTILLISAQGWSSHAGSFSLLGVATHTLHFLAVSVWVGAL
jgi:putative copper export protein